MKIYKVFEFAAAHSLPRIPESHKCQAIHGHNFVVKITIEGSMKLTGWVIDFGVIAEVVKPLIEEIDHKNLNDIAGLHNPTSENIALWFWERLVKKLPGLCEIEVKENASCGAIYDGGTS